LRITTVAERHVIQIAGTWIMDLPRR
jgi:hypothetical protein